MPIGLLDLSIVTDRIVRELKGAVAASRLWIEGGPPGSPATRVTVNVTGLAPDAVREESGCYLSVYLFHVSPEPYNRNTFLREGPRARAVPEMALALTLRYLVTAYSAKSYADEQQAMSIALKWFHEHPTVTSTVPLDGRTESFTLSMQPEPIDDIGRLWQAANISMRLATVYRASVVFIQPVENTKTPRPVEQVRLAVEPLATAPPLPGTAVIAGAVITVTGSEFVRRGVAEVRFAGRTLTAGAAPLAAASFRVVSETEVEMRPDPAPTRGRYPVWITRSDRSLVEAWLEVP